MPKLPWRRGENDGEPPPLSSYLPTQPVDYTALPIVEEEGLGDRFRKLPPIARMGAIVLPILLLGLGLWGLLQLRSPEPASAPPPPQVSLAEARAVNPSEIAIEGSTSNVPDGTPITATLLVNGAASDWADPDAQGGTVTGNRVSLRLSKAPNWSESLDATAAYSVEVTIGSQPPVASRASLIVPGPVAGSFFGEEQAAAATEEPTEAPTVAPAQEAPATAEPTVAPTQAPTQAPTEEATVEPTAPAPAPTVAGPPEIAAAANATLLISPTLGSAIIGRPEAGTTFQPLLRTPDNQFFLVPSGGQAGWLPAGQAAIDPAVAARVPATTPAPEAVQAGPLRASAANGGNIRFLPSIQGGTVLGQMHAREVVTVKARTADGQWYRVVAPAAEGWVSVTLLAMHASVVAQVPVASPNDFLPEGVRLQLAVPSAPAPVAQAPAPTRLPAPAPPAAAGNGLMGAAATGALLLNAPVAGGDVVSRPGAGTPLRTLLRTPDSSFVLVLEGKRTGWIARDHLVLASAQVSQVPPVTPARQAVQAGPLRATVSQDGNVRIGPLPSATILGIARGGEAVTVKARTKDGLWYRVVAPAAEGWLSSVALTISPSVASTVPVAN